MSYSIQSADHLNWPNPKNDFLPFFFLVGTGIASLVVSLVIRLFATYLGLLGNDLSLKERLFIAIAWSPKATVQVCKK